MEPRNWTVQTRNTTQQYEPDAPWTTICVNASEHDARAEFGRINRACEEGRRSGLEIRLSCGPNLVRLAVWNRRTDNAG